MITKNLIFVSICMLCSLNLFPQEQASKNISGQDKNQEGMKTLFGNNRKVDNGGWGGFTLGYTRVNGMDAFLSGGRGGWLIDHRITIGGGGYAFATDMSWDVQTMPTADNYALAGGYGGLLLEPIIAPFKPLHISIPVLIGGGSAGVVDNMDYHGNYNYDSYSACFVLEVGIDLELNIVKFFRLAVNAGYRYTSNLTINYYSPGGIKQFTVPPDAMRGFNAGVTFKFGKF